jgi:hypothetical protein
MCSSTRVNPIKLQGLLGRNTTKEYSDPASTLKIKVGETVSAGAYQVDETPNENVGAEGGT